MILKRNIKIFGWAISLVCLCFFFFHARQSLFSESISLSAADIFRAMATSIIPYMGAYAASALAWHYLLRMLGLRPSLRRSSGIYFSTQIAKYLPGNIGQHIGRVWMSSAYGLPAFRIGLSIAIEMGLVITVAAVLSLPLAPTIVAWITPKLSLTPLTIGAAGVVTVALGAIIYWVKDFHFSRSFRIRITSAWIEARRKGSLGYLPAAIALMGLAMVLAAISLGFLVRGTDIASLGTPMLLRGVALVSASWIAGFVTPGAPAGLGVREAMLLAGLESIVNQQTAFETTLMFRGISIMADLMAFAIGTLLLSSTRMRPTNMDAV